MKLNWSHAIDDHCIGKLLKTGRVWVLFKIKFFQTSFKLRHIATLSISDLLNILNYINYSLLCNSFSFIWTHVSYVCTFLFLQWEKISRLYRTAWVIFCIIGVHILNIIKTHLQMNSNFTSCQKESDEFLHEDFTESKSPDILLGVQPQLYTSSDVFFPPHTLSLHSDHFHRASFQVGTKKAKESLCWKYLRFMFKFSWNLWEHWGAISHLHWHLISQVESESTNCQGFPMCPIILHQFPWPYGMLVN